MIHPVIGQCSAVIGNAGTMIPGEWIIGLIGAVATGIALVVGKLQGRKEAETREVTVKKPMPTVEIREQDRWATRPELEEHKLRTDKQIKELHSRIEDDRATAREALGRIHSRIDNQSEATAELKGSVDGVAQNVDKLLTLALHRNINHRADQGQ